MVTLSPGTTNTPGMAQAGSGALRNCSRPLPDTRLELRRPPVVPRRTAWVTVLVEQVPEAWRPWLPAAA